MKSNPDQKGLFNRVNGDNIRSPQFKAHMSRVLGGIDIIISALNNEDVLRQQLKRYSKFHTYYGSLPYEVSLDKFINRYCQKLQSEEFELTAKSLGAHIETHGKLLLRTLS